MCRCNNITSSMSTSTVAVLRDSFGFVTVSVFRLEVLTQIHGPVGSCSRKGKFERPRGCYTLMPGAAIWPRASDSN